MTQIPRVWLISAENSSDGFSILSLLNGFNLASVAVFFFFFNMKSVVWWL